MFYWGSFFFAPFLPYWIDTDGEKMGQRLYENKTFFNSYILIVETFQKGEESRMAYANDNVLVYNAGLAKALLHQGHNIVDIAQNRNDTKRTVFYFAHDEKIYSDIHQFTQNKKAQSEQD